VSCQLKAPADLPPEKLPVLIGQEAGWVPKPVASAGNQTLTIQHVVHRYTDADLTITESYNAQLLQRVLLNDLRM
jgi:hypothetical protein